MNFWDEIVFLFYIGSFGVESYIYCLASIIVMTGEISSQNLVKKNNNQKNERTI